MTTRRWPAVVPAVVAGALIASLQLGGVGTGIPLYIYSKVADLTIAKVSTDGSVAPGQQLTYRITLHNSGPDRAPSVAMTDLLPSDVTFKSCTAGSGGTCTESNGLVRATYTSLGKSGAPLIKIVVTVNSSVFNGATIKNTAQIQSLAYDPDLGNNSASASVAASHPCDGTWVGQAAPRVESYDVLDGISAVSPTDVWAVGIESIPNRHRHSLIQHWDGTAWSVVPSPSPSTSDAFLTAVSAVSSSNAWAAGYYNTPQGDARALIERWNGRRWQLVSSPEAGEVFLQGVSARTRHDVWVVGSSSPNSESFGHPLIEHWDGTAWTIVPSPSLGSGSSYLLGVWARSASDAWAVGAGNSATYPYKQKSLIEHWDGSAWSIVTSPNVRGSSFTTLNGVFARSTGDAWAVGDWGLSTSEFQFGVIEHWDGAAWRLVRNPSPDSGENLFGVTALSSTDAWAAGFSFGDQRSEPLIDHWDGSSWKVAPTPELPGPAGLHSISADSPTDVWAAGHFASSPDRSDPLIERFC